jgi:exopolyphosphatase/guanosine-5'-triphosphate,3'-diphosphate pyrophosphatase
LRAVIDIGTNSVLLLVGHRVGSRVEIVRDEARITRLGEGIGSSGRLTPAAIDRTVRVLEEYRELARADGAELVAVATEGLRQAANQDAFLEPAARALGQPLTLISGDEEARLSYLSVAREEPDLETLRVLDIGGGSTELVVGHGETIESRRSHKVGSVRMTERFGEDVRAIEAAVREAFAQQPVTPAPVLHGLAGTVTTAAAVMLELEVYDRDRVDGTRWPIGRIEALREELAAETVEQRTARPCLPHGRADVIVAGLTILVEALRHCGATTLVCRDRGLRFALI